MKLTPAQLKNLPKTPTGKPDMRSKKARALKAKYLAAVKPSYVSKIEEELEAPHGGTGYRGTYIPLNLEGRCIEAAGARARQVGGDHYQKDIQPWDAMQVWMSPSEFQGFLRGNALKYLARCNDKGGRQDVEKAQHYIEKLLEVTRSA